MYAKLIFRNVKRSAKDYLIYMVTMTICVMLFYAFLSISSAYYHPAVGAEFDFSVLSDGMKYGICVLTLLLLFLIRYVNNYMLRRRQKEFAIQSVMGMEQSTIGWLFFAETFAMGAVAIVLGIFLGVLCSQFITAMLLSMYGQEYRLSWMLFPDTVLLTICFFSLSFIVVGCFNVRTIRKIKIIDMLYADRRNEPHLKKSRYMPIVSAIYSAALLWMLWSGLVKKHYYFDSRFPFSVHVLFWGNIIAPALALCWWIIGIFRHKKHGWNGFIAGQCVFAVLNTCFAAMAPYFRSRGYFSIGIPGLNQYLTFILFDVVFLICGIIYLAAGLLPAWKEKSVAQKYKGENLFFFGQVISKLQTTTKTMTLICITLVLSIFLFLTAPALSDWASGYLDFRSVFDVAISTRYQDVNEESELPQEDYAVVTDFLEEKGITPSYDRTFSLYLPERSDFHNRIKQDFPVAAIALSDYNALREMLGMEQIVLQEDEFTTHWHQIAAEEEREKFLAEHTEVKTDAGALRLAADAYHTESIGSYIYNIYTNVIYVFPDSVCKELLPVMADRSIMTDDPISYADAIELERMFDTIYPETEEGVHYYITTRTNQVNSTTALIFIFRAMMVYGAVVLIVICLTILALQQLLDANQYRYRFGILYRMGVEEKAINRLVRKQLGVWFGLPVVVAVVISAVVITYFFQMISAQITTYVGFDALLPQIGAIAGILGALLLCYFVSTWILFQRSIKGDENGIGTTVTQL